VFEDYYKHHLEYGDVFYIPTKAFFYGLKHNEEINIEFEDGKMIIVEYLYKTEPNEDGFRTVFFNLNTISAVSSEIAFFLLFIYGIT